MTSWTQLCRVYKIFSNDQTDSNAAATAYYTYQSVAFYCYHYVCLPKENILTKHRMARLVLNCANVPNESNPPHINRLHGYSILR